MGQPRQFSGLASYGGRWSRSLSPKQSLVLTLPEKAGLVPLCATTLESSSSCQEDNGPYGKARVAWEKDLNSKEKHAWFAGKGNGRPGSLQWFEQGVPRARWSVPGAEQRW